MRLRETGTKVRRLLRRREDPYAGAVLSSSRKIVAGLLGLTGVLALAYLPLDPPTAAFGSAGWAVAIPLALASFVGIVGLLDERRAVSYGGLLAMSYLGLLQVGLLVFLAGGQSAEPEDLFPLLVASAAAVHAPRRAAPYMLATAVVICAPLAYDGFSNGAASKAGSEILLNLAFGLILMLYVDHVRRERVETRSDMESAQRLARVDSLTELGNRRAFNEALNTEMARAERAGSPLSIGLIDMDGLKRINDRHGHLAGDRCLRSVAEVVRETVRRNDRCYRWGGDEFALLLADTDRETADSIVERLCAEISASCFDPDGNPVEVSGGVATLNGQARARDLIAVADRGLRMAKIAKRTEAGRP